MTNKPLKIFFIGRVTDFYSESGTMMNDIYEVGTKNRLTWGDAERALKEGRQVIARPATKSELVWAYEKLAAYKKEHRQWQAKERTVPA